MRCMFPRPEAPGEPREDRPSIPSHWSVLYSYQTILDSLSSIGIEERLRREIRWVDEIAPNRQNANALGVENFKHILHHKLTIL